MNQYDALCIVKRRDELSEPTLYRIGDISDGKLYQAYYDRDMPLTIGNKKWEEKEVDSIQVRRWKPREEDERKNDSVKIEFRVFEIIFAQELTGIKMGDEKSIREVLYKGIKVPNGLNSDFIIAIPSNNYKKSAIVCNKKDFQFSGDMIYIREDCSDILHITPCFNIISFNDDELISTELLSERVSDFRDDETRYFFFRTEVDELTEGLLRNYSIDNYSSNYIRAYLNRKKKELSITKKDISLFIDLFDEIAQERNLEDYFSITGYTVDEVKNNIKAKADIIVEEFEGLGDISVFVDATLRNDEDFYYSCLETAKDAWLKSADEEKKKAEKDIQKLNEQKRTLEEECQRLKSDRETINADIVKGNDSLSAVIRKQQNVEQEIDDKLQSFKESVVEIAFSQALSTSITTKTSNNSKSFIRINQPICENQIDDLYDLSMALSDNFGNGGMPEAFSFECALYTIAAIISGRVMVIPATISINFANALSNTLDGCDASLYICSNCLDDVNSLISEIVNVPSRVVLIKNCIDLLNSSFIDALRIAVADKIIICDYYDETNVDILPSIFKSIAAVIRNESIMLPETHPIFDKSFVKSELLSIDIKEIAVKERFKHLQIIKNMTDINDYELYAICSIETVISIINPAKTMLNIFNVTAGKNAIVEEEEFTAWITEHLGESKAQFVVDGMII